MEKKPVIELEGYLPFWEPAVQLERQGYQVFLVGGWVRDSLLGRPVHDCDLATNATPEQMRLCFAGERILERGSRYGTLTLLRQAGRIEITTFRRESGYTDGRRPSRVSWSDSLWDDLARRDFTVNAMAYHPQTGLQDPFGGYEDLQAGRVRAVGVAAQRFAEDALRILRGLRFSVTLGWRLERDTLHAVNRMAAQLSLLSQEWICEELSRILAAPYPTMLLPCRPVWEVLIPEFQDEELFTCFVSRLAELPPRPLGRWAALLCTLSEQGRWRFLEQLPFSRKQRRRIKVLLRGLESPPEELASFCRMVEELGEEGSEAFFALSTHLGWQSAERIQGWWEVYRTIRRERLYSRADLAIAGKDLLALGWKPGKELGKLLEELWLQVLAGNLPNRAEALLRFVRECMVQRGEAACLELGDGFG